MASVTYQNVYKSFGNVEVIKGVDLAIDDGELVVFVGPSGCGKSTLLRLLAGLEELTEGDIYIGPRQVNDVSPADRNVSMVFQNYALYPHMTVAQNLAYGLKLRKVDKKERQEAVERAARILGLTEFLGRKPRQLSGGQRQRVAMGRAIVRNPDVFLMDEPLSNLDAALRNHMRVEIRQLQRKLGTTMIYVTHDQIEALTLADRIVVLRDGEVAQFGPPTQCYEKPADQFVAGFIGTPAMNFFPSKWGGDGLLMLPGGVRLNLPEARKNKLAGHPDFTVGIRPEHISIDGHPEGPGPGRVSWPSRVALCELLGAESLIHTEMGEHPVRVKVGRRDRFPEGSPVNLAFDVAYAHIFSSTDGLSLSHAEKA